VGSIGVVLIWPCRWWSGAAGAVALQLRQTCEWRRVAIAQPSGGSHINGAPETVAARLLGSPCSIPRLADPAPGGPAPVARPFRGWTGVGNGLFGRFAIVYACSQRLGTILGRTLPGDGESRPEHLRPDQPQGVT